MPAAGAQYGCGLFEPGVQIRPEAAYHAQHDGGVVEDVRQQDHPNRLLNLHGRLTEMKRVHEPAVDFPVGTKQGAEGRSHHHCRHDEGNRTEDPQHGFAGKRVAGEHVSRGQAYGQGVESRDSRLPGSEPEHAAIVRLPDEYGHRRQVKPAVGRQADAQNLEQRIEEKDGQKHQRDH